MASVHGRHSPQDSSDESFYLECSPCKHEGVTAEAKHFCPECGDYLCESCKQTHQGLSVTRNHHLMPGNKMPKKGENFKYLTDPKLALCSCNAKEVTAFCEDHSIVICADCKLLQHKICKAMDISNKCTDTESSPGEARETTMLELKKELETLQMKRKEDMHELESQGDRAREIVLSFRRDLNYLTDWKNNHLLI